MKFASAVAALLPTCAGGLLAGGKVAVVQERTLAAEALVGDGCGPVPSYPHAKPQNYEDSKKTFYNGTSKQHQSVNFASGTNISFECRPGYTTDGSKDGSTTFQVECAEHGYYKPHGVCLKANKCGPLPNISHAAATGRVKGSKVEFACSQGYSLDGKTVVNGGLGKNRFFELECIEFSGTYKAFDGECKAFAFVPAKETIRIYNKVTEALFVVSCKGSLKKAFGKGETPSGLDTVCSTFEDSGPACGALVTQIKSDFTSKLAEREAHKATKDWYNNTDDESIPGIGDEAQRFCMDLWKLLEMPSL